MNTIQLLADNGGGPVPEGFSLPYREILLFIATMNLIAAAWSMTRYWRAWLNRKSLPDFRDLMQTFFSMGLSVIIAMMVSTMGQTGSSLMSKEWSYGLAITVILADFVVLASWWVLRWVSRNTEDGAQNQENR